MVTQRWWRRAPMITTELMHPVWMRLIAGMRTGMGTGTVLCIKAPTMDTRTTVMGTA
jgi:hypothetical protein